MRGEAYRSILRVPGAPRLVLARRLLTEELGQRPCPRSFVFSMKQQAGGVVLSLRHEERAPVLAEVPLLPGDLGSLADLGVIARHLFPVPAAAPTSAGHVGR